MENNKKLSIFNTISDTSLGFTDLAKDLTSSIDGDTLIVRAPRDLVLRKETIGNLGLNEGGGSGEPPIPMSWLPWRHYSTSQCLGRVKASTRASDKDGDECGA